MQKLSIDEVLICNIRLGNESFTNPGENIIINPLKRRFRDLKTEAKMNIITNV